MARMKVEAVDTSWPVTMRASPASAAASLEKYGFREVGRGVWVNLANDEVALVSGRGTDTTIKGMKELARIIAGALEDDRERGRIEAEHAPGMEQCPECGAAIRWVRLRASDDYYPIDAVPSERGVLVLLPDGVTVRKLEPGEQPTGRIYRAHIGTCPRVLTPEARNREGRARFAND